MKITMRGKYYGNSVITPQMINMQVEYNKFLNDCFDITVFMKIFYMRDLKYANEIKEQLLGES